MPSFYWKLWKVGNNVKANYIQAGSSESHKTVDNRHKTINILQIACFLLTLFYFYLYNLVAFNKGER